MIGLIEAWTLERITKVIQYQCGRILETGEVEKPLIDTDDISVVGLDNSCIEREMVELAIVFFNEWLLIRIEEIAERWFTEIVRNC